ncbi:MAG: hypothetical protein Q7S79_01660 [bacterium]|nr:hypothetical protein [bacterium]
MEKLKLSYEGQKLERGWRGVIQMPNAELQGEARIAWEAIVLKPLIEAGLDILFLEHLEITIADTDLKRKAPTFCAEPATEADLDERQTSGRLAKLPLA